MDKRLPFPAVCPFGPGRRHVVWLGSACVGGGVPGLRGCIRVPPSAEERSRVLPRVRLPPLLGPATRPPRRRRLGCRRSAGAYAASTARSRRAGRPRRHALSGLSGTQPPGRHLVPALSGSDESRPAPPSPGDHLSPGPVTSSGATSTDANTDGSPAHAGARRHRRSSSDPSSPASGAPGSLTAGSSEGGSGSSSVSDPAGGAVAHATSTSERT